MREFSFEISDVEYSGKTASAKNQMDALHIMGRSSALMTVLKGDVAPMTMVAAMVSALSVDEVRQLESLLVKGCIVRAEDEVPVAANLFGDDIQDYYLLIGNTAIENLKGFWKLQRPTDASKTVEQP